LVVAVAVDAVKAEIQATVEQAVQEL
jgi:hypothetical protein